MKKQVYVFGNGLVEIDSLPIKIMPQLKKRFPEIEFTELDPSEDFPREKEVVILDTVIGLKEAAAISDISKLEIGRICSLHDFDLAYNLKLMKKFRLIEKISIIGLPPGMDEGAAVLQASAIIASLFSENG